MRVRLIARVLCLLCLTQTCFAVDRPTIAAASDLQFALREIAEHFTATTGFSVRLSFGSSGNFQRQIQQGAPYELFLSADEAYVFALHELGLTRDRGELYALGRVMLYAPHPSPLQVDEQLQGLKQALDSGSLSKFAIANPQHAPYGRAAQQVLEHAGLWDAIKPRLVMGENASQATRFASSGSTAGGIIPHSLYAAKEISGKGRGVLIPADWHQPLRQRMVLLKNAGNTAQLFYRFIQNGAAREILSHYGFSTELKD